jgi:hypothetical protein
LTKLNCNSFPQFFESDAAVCAGTGTFAGSICPFPGWAEAIPVSANDKNIIIMDLLITVQFEGMFYYIYEVKDEF